MNLLYDLARHESFVAQWLEHPTGVRKIIGSTSFGDLNFSLSHARDMFDTGSCSRGAAVTLTTK